MIHPKSGCRSFEGEKISLLAAAYYSLANSLEYKRCFGPVVSYRWYHLQCLLRIPFGCSILHYSGCISFDRQLVRSLLQDRRAHSWSCLIHSHQTEPPKWTARVTSWKTWYCWILWRQWWTSLRPWSLWGTFEISKRLREPVGWCQVWSELGLERRNWCHLEYRYSCHLGKNPRIQRQPWYFWLPNWSATRASRRLFSIRIALTLAGWCSRPDFEMAEQLRNRSVSWTLAW